MINHENQHWIPRFLLRNFADSDGRVYRFNVADDTVTKPPPKFAAARLNFNELLVDGDPKSFEDAFERLETAAAPAIAKVIELRSLHCITSQQRNALTRFIAAQTFRTEAYRLGLGAPGRQYDLGTTLAMHMSDLDALAGLIGQRRWALMITDSEEPFYLGDNPVVLQSTERPGRGGEVGLDMAGIEAFMPVSPNCALYMPCPTTGSEIIAGFWNALRIVSANVAGLELADFEVAKALPIARRTLESAGPLYRAMTLGEALIADEGNVQNLNYLQCAWSSSAIYSNRPDFSFASRVFRENPAYRDTMPVSLRQVRGWTDSP